MPQPPTLNFLADQQAHPSTPLTFTATAVDPQGSPIQYSLVNPPIGATINAGTGQFTWNPAVSQLGTWTVTVQALATQTGLFDQKSFTATVANQPPSLNPLADHTAHPGVALTFTATATDPDGDSVTFTLVNPPQGASISAAGQFSWSPNWNQLGAFNITVRVTDPCGASDQKSCTVTVANQAPTLNPLNDQTAHPQHPLTFTATASDPDGDQLTFSLVNPPQGAIITAGGLFSWTPAWNQLGAFNITVRVADPGGATDQKSFTVTVANQPPRLNALADQAVVHGNQLTFAVSATDPDGDPLQLSLVSPPPGAILQGSQFTWTPTAAQVGAWTVTVRVTDPSGAADQKQCTVTVT